MVQGFLKHPEVYVEATLNNIYGYFYPGHTRWYIYSNYYSLINDEGVVDYHYNSLQPLRDILALGEMLSHIFQVLDFFLILVFTDGYYFF